MPKPNMRHIHVTEETLAKMREVIPRIHLAATGALGLLGGIDGIDVFPPDEDGEHGTHMVMVQLGSDERVFIE